MPTYEYECLECGKHFEVFQKISDNLLKECPHCKSNKLRRLIGGGCGLIFKGSGFYITDYKRKKDAPSKDKKSQEASSEKKSDK